MFQVASVSRAASSAQGQVYLDLSIAGATPTRIVIKFYSKFPNLFRFIMSVFSPSGQHGGSGAQTISQHSAMKFFNKIHQFFSFEEY